MDLTDTKSADLFRVNAKKIREGFIREQVSIESPRSTKTKRGLFENTNLVSKRSMIGRKQNFDKKMFLQLATIFPTDRSSITLRMGSVANQ